MSSYIHGPGQIEIIAVWLLIVALGIAFWANVAALIGRLFIP